MSPRSLRNDYPHLGLVWAAPEPVWVDERPPAPVAEDHALVCELRERAAHRRSTDAVLLAELMLRRQPVSRSVPAAQNLLQEERLELVVERDRLL